MGINRSKFEAACTPSKSNKNYLPFKQKCCTILTTFSRHLRRPGFNFGFVLKLNKIK